MSVPKSKKQKKQPSQKCPKCEPASPAATEDLTDEEEEEKKALLKYGLDIDAERRLMQREPTEMRRLRLWRAKCRISFEMNENKKQLRNRYHGALLGLAAGDALGTTLEFKSPGTFRPLTDMVGGGPFNLQPGHGRNHRSCVAEAKELLTDLAKHDSATFTRHQNPPGWQAAKLVERETEKDAEITRLRERVALLDGLLGECLRHHYYDDNACSPSWLAEARSAVTSTTRRMVDE